jgi:hypothetical protein
VTSMRWRGAQVTSMRWPGAQVISMRWPGAQVISTMSYEGMFLVEHVMQDLLPSWSEIRDTLF